MNIAAIGSYIFFSDVNKRYLQELGDFNHFDVAPSEENLIKYSQNIEVLFTWGKVTTNVLNSLTKLKFIGLLSTGYRGETLDPDVTPDYLTNRGLIITYTPDCSTSAVVEYTIAGILSSLRKILLPKKKLINTSMPMSYFKSKELSEVKIGIVGLGKIGIEIANVCSVLGAKDICCYTKHPNRKRDRLNAPVTFCKLDDLVSSSDVIVISCELNSSTYGMINDNYLNQMSDNVIIVNSSRGNILNLKDAYSFISSKKDAILVIDELPNNNISQKLKQLENVVYTPHIAFNTTQGLYNYTQMAVANLKSYIKGTPENVVYLEQI